MLSNDFDNEGDALRAILDETTTHGELALNEVLVAGDQVAGLGRLRDHPFKNRRDQIYWAELTQRRL